MTHEVRLEQSTGQPLAVVRRRASSQELGKVVPEACGIVWNAIRAHHVQGAGRHVAVYLDSEINLEVGAEVPPPFAGAGEVVASGTPAGPVVTTTHYGPYGSLHGAHAAIQAWCANRGYRLAGPSWEVYGHWQNEWNNDPTKIRTDVYYLVDGRGSSSGEVGAT
jgi:effector-binding domain-containing protein